MSGYTTLFVGVVGHCKSHEIHVKVTNKTVIGFWAQFINGGFFFHTLDWHKFQVSKFVAWNLGHQIQEASSTKFDHPQVIALLVNSGDALVNFSQTFVIQVCIVEEVVSTWIVCFLWNDYCIVRVHSRFWNHEWPVASIQFELLAFWISMLFYRFIWAKVVTTRFFEIPKRYVNCHGAGGLRATKDSTDTTPKAWFDIGDLVWSLGNSIEGLFFCSVNLNSSFIDRFHIEGKAMWSQYTAAVDNTSVFFLGFLILTWPYHL